MPSESSAGQASPAPGCVQADGRGWSWLRRLDSEFSESSELIALALLALGFCWRLWLAHATFFNSDEAWHFAVANQDSLLAAYQASLTLAHPPLLVLILYWWRHLGTSEVMLRLP